MGRALRPRYAERKFSPNPISAATINTTIPTKKPIIDMKRARLFETRLNKGAQAHTPPAMKSMAAGTTNDYSEY